MPVAVARRFLRFALEEAALLNCSTGQRTRLGRSAGASDFGHVQRILALALRGRSGTTLSLPGKIRARKEFSSLLLETAGTDRTRFQGYSYEVTVPETVEVPEIPSSFAFELIPLASGMARYNEKWEELLDRAVIQESLVLRNWQAGDSFRQRGHRKSRKIKELFQRWRVSRSRRQRWPVVVAGHQIVWSRKWGIAEGFTPRPGSREALRIRERMGEMD
jgi:tRNA(Ile)-lysidine synthase